MDHVITLTIQVTVPSARVANAFRAEVEQERFVQQHLQEHLLEALENVNSLADEDIGVEITSVVHEGASHA